MLGVAFCVCRLRQSLDRGAIHNGTAAPVKSCAVHGDGLAVQLYRAFDGGGRHRNSAELISVANEEHVGADRLAEQRGCQSRGIDEVRVVATRVCDDGALEPLAWQEEVCIAGEFTR